MTLECDAAVVISYTELLEEEDKSLLYPRLIDAFASSNSSLGLLIISDLPPAFAEPRHKLLHYSNTFAALDESIKDKYVSPPTYSFGWSHGKEMMAGLPDVHKGSYYANTCDDARNVWPDVEAGCEGFQRVFKDLCSLMVGVGERIASLCDGALRIDAREGVATKGIAQLIGESKQSKARLLHYFPPADQSLSLVSPSQIAAPQEEDVSDSWCGTHVDHSILTALLPAMYLFHPHSVSPLQPLVIPSPSSSAGLYVKTRSGRTVKASIPANCLAFQTGETLSLLSSHRLAATPHFVNGNTTSIGDAALKVILAKKRDDPSWSDVQSGSISRETLAVFLQPNNEEIVGAQDGETFGQFSDRVSKRHYSS